MLETRRTSYSEVDDPEWMYPPVVTGPPPPYTPPKLGAPLAPNGAEYNFERDSYMYEFECEAEEIFYVSHAQRLLGEPRVNCPACGVHVLAGISRRK